MALGDEVGRQRLRRRHLLGPRVGVAERLERGVIGEVGAATRSRGRPTPAGTTRAPGARPWAVRGDDRGAAAAGGVDEHLAAAVLLDERRRRQGRVEALGPLGDRPGRGRGVLPARRRRRDEHVDALGAAGLHRAGEADVGERLAHERRGRDGGGERRRAPAGRGRARGRSLVEVGRRAPASGGTRRRAGWRTTAASAGRCTARRSRCAWRPPPNCSVRTHSGVYFGTFFCMNGAWPPVARGSPTAAGRAARAGCGRARASR